MTQKILRVRQLKEALNNVPDNLYIAVGTKENNEIDEVRNEYGIEDIKMKSIGFSDSNEKYLKIYIDKYKESGCMRFAK